MLFAKRFTPGQSPNNEGGYHEEAFGFMERQETGRADSRQFLRPGYDAEQLAAKPARSVLDFARRPVKKEVFRPGGAI
jgi:hypothetical protein